MHALICERNCKDFSRLAYTLRRNAQIVLLAASLGAGFAHANDEATTVAPWSPEAVDGSVQPYVPDPSFNQGHLGLDHFAAPNGADEVGGPTAQLTNGDTLVAGLVPNYGATGTCNDGVTLCNIGLVHYNAAGARVAWSNPGDIGHFGNQYVVYPGTGGLYQFIRDVKVRAGYIDVLVDEIDSSHSGLGREDVRIVTFREDGSYLAQWPVFGKAGAADEDIEDFYGAQMVQINAGRMIVAATGYDDIGPYVAVTRVVILGNGALSQDTDWAIPTAEPEASIRSSVTTRRDLIAPIRSTRPAMQPLRTPRCRSASRRRLISTSAPASTSKATTGTSRP